MAREHGPRPRDHHAPRSLSRKRLFSPSTLTHPILKVQILISRIIQISIHNRENLATIDFFVLKGFIKIRSKLLIEQFVSTIDHGSRLHRKTQKAKQPIVCFCLQATGCLIQIRPLALRPRITSGLPFSVYINSNKSAGLNLAAYFCFRLCS